MAKKAQKRKYKRDKIPYYVYKHYNKDGTLLYVGITKDIRKRSKAHTVDSRWFCNVTYVEFEMLDRRSMARKREGELIALHQPINNNKGVWGRYEFPWYDGIGFEKKANYYSVKIRNEMDEVIFKERCYTRKKAAYLADCKLAELLGDSRKPNWLLGYY